ncbi:MAG: dolichyl-phosphate beta-glucosyltransferase [Patescibacteria group bacterium]
MEKKPTDIFIKEKVVTGARHREGGGVYLSVVIPAYNESQRIIPTLEAVDQYLKKQDYSYEIIVVANNCTDNTVEVLLDQQNKIQHLEIYDLEILKPGGGKGYAVKKGVEKSRGEYIVFMDADNATKIDEIGNFWKFFKEGYSVVIGSRHIKGSKIVVQQPLHRRILGRVANLVIRLLLLPGIHDTQCGFKAFTRDAGKKIFALSEIGGWGFDMELLALARHFRYTVAEVPVSWYEAGDSRLRAVKAASSTLSELFHIRNNIKTGYYDKKK